MSDPVSVPEVRGSAESVKDGGDEKITPVEAYKAKKALLEQDVVGRRGLWHFPELTREQRVNLVDRLHKGAEWNFSFGVLTALSTAIASLGLIQGSAATVIGAMVVAPLMLPLIAAGLSIIQGNVHLFRVSSNSMLLGVLFALGSSLLIGFVIPRSDISMELLSRGNPNILDLGVAFFAGFAAAYAFALPELLGALAGVAIAVALVPPLATCGIAFADGLWALSYGSGLLFLTNMIAIVVGAAWAFRCLGVIRASESETPLWIRRSIISLILGVVLLSGLLGYKMMLQLTEGQNRPASYPLTKRVIDSIEDYLDDHRNVNYVTGGRQIDSNGHLVVKLYLSSNRAIESDFRLKLVDRISDLFGGDVEVHVHIFQEVAGSQAVTYSADSQGVISQR
jgi:uncharacterized hydrophobic protein (TIGR00271 family)